MTVTGWFADHGDFVEIYEDADGQFRWRVVSKNNEIVGQGEAHPRRSDAIAAASRHHPAVGSELPSEG